MILLYEFVHYGRKGLKSIDTINKQLAAARFSSTLPSIFVHQVGKFERGPLGEQFPVCKAIN